MKKRISAKPKTLHKTRRFGGLGVICWIVIPLTAITLLALDGLQLYEITTMRLIVCGASCLAALIPYINEVSLKNFSIKRNKDSD